MPLKNNNAVAVERRVDLASFFCMIGRHGPAVVLAVIAMVSVLAGLLIYRSVRGKRRKATAAAGMEQPEPDPREAPTDVCDEDSSESSKEDPDLIQSDLKIRQRRAAAAAAAERKAPSSSPPKGNIHVRHSNPDDVEEMAVVQDSYKEEEMFAEKPNHSLQMSSNSITESEVIDAVACCSSTEDHVMDTKEICDEVSSLIDPQPTDNENLLKVDEMVFKKEHQEEISEKNTAQEEATVTLIPFEQSLHMNDNGTKQWQDDQTTQEMNSVESSFEEPIVAIEEANVICHLENAEFREDNHHPDNSDYTDHCSSDEKKKNELENAEREVLDHGLPHQQPEIWSTTFEQETVLQSTQQDQCDDLMDTVALPLQETECDNNGNLISERALVVPEEEHLNDLSAVDIDAHPLQSDEQELKVEEKGDMCNQEDSVAPSGADHVPIVCADAGSDGHDSLRLLLGPDQQCLSDQVKVDDDGLPDITTDTTSEISSIADISATSMPSECGETHRDGQDTNHFHSGPMMSHETEEQPESKESGTTATLDEECSACDAYQVSIQTTDGTITDEDITCPLPKPACQDQQTHEVDKIETPAPDAAETSFALPVMPDEISHVDVFSSIQDQPTLEMDKSEGSEETRVNSLPDGDKVSFTDPVVSGDVAHVDVDQPTLQIDKNESFGDTMVDSAVDCDKVSFASFASPVFSEDVAHVVISSSTHEQPNHELEKGKSFEEMRDNSAADGDKVSFAEPLMSEDIATVAILPSSKGHQSFELEKDESFEETRVDSATVGDQVSSAEPVMSEDLVDVAMLSFTQDQQSHELEKDECFEETRVDSATVTDQVSFAEPAMSDDMAHVTISSSSEDQQSPELEKNGSFEVINYAGDEDEVKLAESIMPDEVSHIANPSSSQDQPGDDIFKNKAIDEIGANSAADDDKDSFYATLISDETSHTDILISCQDQPYDQTQNNEDFIGAGAASVESEDINSSMCPIHRLPLEQSELRDNGISSPGFAVESGISSMAVSPDFQDVAFDMIVDHMDQSVMDWKPKSEKMEPEISPCADYRVASVIKEDSAGMVFGPFPSYHPHQPQSQDMDPAKYEASATNEDTFGHEIEGRYQKVMDEFAAQIAASVTTFSVELKRRADFEEMKEPKEVEIKKKEAVSCGKKVAADDDKEKDEECDKTNISIMEATMDNNEWITETNHQLPWMNLSAQSIVEAQTKTDQLLIEESQHSASPADYSFVDTDIPPTDEVKPTSPLAAADENTENGKRVVAVQPMPQNVNVTFRVHYLTRSPHHTVAITGNHQELGNWEGFVPLERAKDGHWVTVVSLPAECHVEWKFVVVDKGAVCRWEECGNRLLDTGYGDDLLVHKWWGFL